MTIDEELRIVQRKKISNHDQTKMSFEDSPLGIRHDIMFQTTASGNAKILHHANAPLTDNGV